MIAYFSPQLMTGSDEAIDLFIQENLSNLSAKALSELAGNGTPYKAYACNLFTVIRNSVF